jgi:sugar diacid utilization regulator
MSDQIKLGSYSLKLLDALAEDKGLQHILDVGFELIGNPIIVSDLSHKVLAHTRGVHFDDPLWNDIVRKGYRPYSLVAAGSSHGLFERIRNSDKPITTPQSELHNPSLYMRVAVDNKAIGYITIASVFRKFEDIDYEIVQLLSKTISQEMQKNKFFRSREGVVLEYFLTDLLENKIEDISVFEERIKYLNIKNEGNHYIVLIRAVHSIPMSQVRIQNEEIELFGSFIYYKDDIVLLLNRNEKIIQPNEELSRLIELIAKNNLTGAISRCFYSLLDIKEAYSQARKAMELGPMINKEQTLHSYEDYAVYHFISSHSYSSHTKDEDITKFCHPILKTLEEHDKNHDTQLLETLQVYLENDKRLTESSAILHIHRNTLRSRIYKISEVTNVDLDDPELSFHLMLSFKIKFATKKLNLNIKNTDTGANNHE